MIVDFNFDFVSEGTPEGCVVAPPSPMAHFYPDIHWRVAKLAGSLVRILRCVPVLQGSSVSEPTRVAEN